MDERTTCPHPKAGPLASKSGGLCPACLMELGLDEEAGTGPEAATAFTGTNGVFSFGNVPPGTYTITMALGDDLITVSGMRVSAGATTTLEETVDWDVGFSDTLFQGRVTASGTDR